MAEIIGAQHEFHDAAFAVEWADRFVPTPARLALFDLVLSELKSKIPERGRVVELGIGPGYLADHVLRAMPGIQYCGIDYSRPMLDISRSRLRAHSARVAYLQADLVNDTWWDDVPAPVSAIISTWALHDLGSRENVEIVYKSCAQVLQDGGLFLNGDFIKPEKTRYEFEPGRFRIVDHLAILRRVGFERAGCLESFEEELQSPTAGQNYACFRGVR